MGRGTQLNSAEVKVALNLHKNKAKISEIAKQLNRSRKVISNLLKDPENYGKAHSGGRPKSITTRQERAILRVASNSDLTAKKIAEAAGVETRVRNVQRFLQKSLTIQRKKLQRKPPLTATHRQERLQFAEEHIKWNKRWRRVMFTDEKKFNLDGPDGWAYFYHDLRKEPKVLSRRQHGGGCVMIWAGIGYRGRSEIKFVPSRMNSKDYINLIGNEVVNRGHHVTKGSLIFQQDNAIVKQFFNEKNINILKWPSRSPDLNIIENCWGSLARKVYSENRQYDSSDELKSSLLAQWDEIPQKYIKKLFKSLPNRMTEVIKKNGPLIIRISFFLYLLLLCVSNSLIP